jgi:hypothetical protein
MTFAEAISLTLSLTRVVTLSRRRDGFPEVGAGVRKNVTSEAYRDSYEAL